jgi:acyl dehydratase
MADITSTTPYDAIHIGDTLPPWSRVTDIMHWNRYAAVNDEFLYFHMEDEAARAALNPQGAFGMGNLRFAYLHNALEAVFGDVAAVRELSCQFRTINQKGDCLTVTGTVTEKWQDGTERLLRITLDVRNQHSDSTCPGEAVIAYG